jgi:hypothetical protein
MTLEESTITLCSMIFTSGLRSRSRLAAALTLSSPMLLIRRGSALKFDGETTSMSAADRPFAAGGAIEQIGQPSPPPPMQRTFAFKA